MKRFRFFFLGTVAWIVVGIAGNAQPVLSTKSKKAIDLYTEADNYRVRGQFDQAIQMLNQAIAKDKNFEEAYWRLGTTQKDKEDFTASSVSFEKGLSLCKDGRRQSNYHFELGDNYLRVGDYEKSLDHLKQFLITEKGTTVRADKAKAWKDDDDYALAHRDEHLAYQPEVLSDIVNAFPMQYFPTLTADNQQLVFTKRTGRGYNDDEDIVISIKDSSGLWTTPVSISGNINSSAREGACTISADGHHLIFTVCGSKTYGRCDLFESKKSGSTWSHPENLGPLVNSSAWDAQPSLSADGQELYFVSDRKGGFGGSDVWYSKRDSTSRWTRAQNLGPVINTKLDEISPYIHVNNRNLYFSSNAHPGFGGQDIFVSEKVNGKWSNPENMGAPLNNFEDQYAFFVTADGRRAYYSKDESGKKNFTKLYTTPLPEQLRIHFFSNVVKGRVKSSRDGKALKASVELYDIGKNERLSMVQSDSITGEYTIILTKGSEYALYSTCPGYLFKSLSFNYEASDYLTPVTLDIMLDEIQINATSVLNNIFFETDRFDLEEKSLTELQEVARFLSENPEIRVEIGGHTDNTGSAAHNLQLSGKRAQSVSEYLIRLGVAGSRLVQKGYGAEKPVKPNDSEEHRQANRRIEFKILN
jgi:OmpA-OmpF porin, OOP family